MKEKEKEGKRGSLFPVEKDLAGFLELERPRALGLLPFVDPTMQTEDRGLEIGREGRKLVDFGLTLGSVN